MVKKEMITDCSLLQRHAIFFDISCDTCQTAVQMKVVSFSSARQSLSPDCLIMPWTPREKSHYALATL